VDEDRLVQPLGHREKFTLRGPPGRRTEHVGGQLHTEKAVVQQGLKAFDVGLEQVERRPGFEGFRKRGGAGVPGVEELAISELLDTERTRQRHDGERRTEVLLQRHPLVDRVRRRIHVVRRFGRGVQCPAVEVRRCVASPEPVDELLRPQVLVDVDHGFTSRT
jgi:hypothetical protein